MTTTQEYYHHFLNSYLHHEMVAPKFNIVNIKSDSSQNPYMNHPNIERPPDTAVNIQRDHMPSWNLYRIPCSLSLSPMDSPPPSEDNYAERTTALNNRIDIEMANPMTDCSSAHMPQSQRIHNKVVPIASYQPVPSTLPIIPLALSYKANVPADPNLWNGYFGPVSLFGTNEFLQSNAHNILCSLIHMAEFIRQRNIWNWDGNEIPQIDSFGEAAFNFISAIYKAGWDKLNTLDKATLRCKIQLQYIDPAPSSQSTGKRNPVKQILPPIPSCLPCKQIEEAKKCIEQRKKNKNMAKLYAQASSLAANILKLRDAFSALPNKKIIKIHNATLNKPPPKGKKIQVTTKGPSRKQAIVLILTQHLAIIMNNAGYHVGSINSYLKGLKSTLWAEFIWPSAEGLIITTNSVPTSSDLITMEKYIKSIEGINQNNVSILRLPQSKLYLKITGIPYIQFSNLALTSDDITNYLKNSDLFKDITLAAKPCIIKASSKSGMAIISQVTH